MKSKRRYLEMFRTVLPFVVLSVFLGLGTGRALAATDTWQGGANRDWFAATNWTPATPTLADDAVVNNGQNALIQGPSVATANNLFINAGSVTLGNLTPGTLTVVGQISVGGIGSGQLHVDAGTVSVNTLTIDTGGSYSDSSSSTLNLTGVAPTIQVANGNTVTINSAVQGTTGLNKGGLGPLILNGNNPYSGPTTITLGTLQIGNGGSTGTLGTGDVVDNGSLIFNKSSTLVVSNNISGTGTLAQSGSGKTTLTGDNTYTGLTTINSGTLQVGNGGTSGSLGSADVVDNGTLAFNRSDTITVSNQISGTGNLTQAGTGTTILTNNNTYAGTTTISAGTLQVGDGGINGSVGAGNIVDNGTLAMNRSDTVTLSNSITGTGNFVQNGAGAVIVTGNNSFSGGSAVNGGTVQIGNGGATGSLGSGNITNNGAVIVDLNGDTVISGDISGNGTVTQFGTGRTILTGTNTYSGLTTISNGTLMVGNGGTSGSLGTGNVVNNGNLALNLLGSNNVFGNQISGSGGLIQIGNGTNVLTANNTYTGGTTINAGKIQVGNGGTTGSLGTGNITNNGTLSYFHSDNISIDNTISGSGKVAQVGANTVTFTADNSYSGGTTINTNATVQVGNGGTSGSLGTGDISDNGALIYNRSDTITVSNQINGLGSFAQSGSGTLILTGNNNNIGTNYINSGIVQVGNGGTSGALGTNLIINNGTLAFDRSDSITLNNTLTGTGGLIQGGTGSLLLAATNTYSGGTTITNGSLFVHYGRALGSGDLNVLNGTFGADNSLNSGLQMFVGGNYVQGTNGTLTIRVGTFSGTNTIDQLLVPGTATLLSNSTVTVTGPYNIRPNDELAFFFASNGLTGEFTLSNKLTHSPLLNIGLEYLTTNALVTVAITATQASFVTFLSSNNISLRPNQSAVAAALDSIAKSKNTNDTALLAFLDNLANVINGLAPAFDLVAPEELTAMQAASFATMDAEGDRFLQRVNNLRTDYHKKYVELRKFAVSGEAFDDYVNKPWDIYFEPLAEFANVKGDDNASGYDMSRLGVSAGADRRVNDSIFAGAAISIGGGTADLVNSGKIDSTSVSGQFYATWFQGGAHLEAMIGGLYTSYDTKRTAVGGTAKGSATGFGFMGLVGGGYDWENGPWRVGPQAALEFETVSVESFTETGSLSPLKIKAQDATAAHLQGGLNVRYVHQKSKWTYVTPSLFLAWRHELGDDQLSIDSQFASGAGSSFTVDGPKMGKDSIIGGLGISVQWKPALNTYANFTTQMGRDGYDAQGLNLGAQFGF